MMQNFSADDLAEKRRVCYNKFEVANTQISKIRYILFCTGVKFYKKKKEKMAENL